VLAAKNNQCTGIKNKHTTSDVNAMHTNKTENACKQNYFYENGCLNINIIKLNCAS
jgi:hypothetical protein